jgi:hypothetical protein
MIQAVRGACDLLPGDVEVLRDMATKPQRNVREEELLASI